LLCYIKRKESERLQRRKAIFALKISISLNKRSDEEEKDVHKPQSTIVE
jgi:hypothetical protein